MANHFPGLDAAIRAAGSQAKLAGLITRAGRRCTQQTVSYWQKELGGKVPEDWCALIEGATSVRCEDMRPDIEWVRDTGGKLTHYKVRIVGRLRPTRVAREKRQVSA